LTLTGRRYGARAVDLVACLLLWQLGAPGPVLAVLWLLLADALPRGASLGKRAFGLRVLHAPSGRPCGLRRSLVRNLPLAATLPLTALGWVGDALALMLGAAVWAFEGALVWTEDDGVRIGDIFAETVVVDERTGRASQPLDDEDDDAGEDDDDGVDPEPAQQS